MQEKWRAVVGYEGLYEVSDLGRVKGLTRRARKSKDGTLSPHVARGYEQVKLYRNGTGINRPIHKLVAAAFIGPTPPGNEVNHANGRKRNNAASNLEFMTPMQNTHHAMDLGLFDNRGERNGESKLTESEVLKIRESYATGGESYTTLANRFGVAFQTIGKIVTRKKWRHL